MRAYRDFLPGAPEELGIFVGLKTLPPVDPFPKEHSRFLSKPWDREQLFSIIRKPWPASSLKMRHQKTKRSGTPFGTGRSPCLLRLAEFDSCVSAIWARYPGLGNRNSGFQ
jgi:hypothetical protein